MEWMTILVNKFHFEQKKASIGQGFLFQHTKTCATTMPYATRWVQQTYGIILRTGLDIKLVKGLVQLQFQSTISINYFLLKC